MRGNDAYNSRQRVKYWPATVTTKEGLNTKEKPQYVIIHVDGTVTTEDVEEDILTQMQRIVEGYIEPIQIPGWPMVTMLVDEIRVLKVDPVKNARASLLAERPIYGTIVLANNEGDDLEGFTGDRLATLIHRVKAHEE